MDKNQQAASDRLISFKIVSHITRIKSPNTIKAQEDRGTFPKRRYLSGKCVRWSESEVMEWVNQLPNTLEEYQRRQRDAVRVVVTSSQQQH